MRGLILTTLILLNAASGFSQAPNKSVNVDALWELVGTGPQNAGITFLGDDMIPYLTGEAEGFNSWAKVKRKTDVFIVFSQKA